MLFSHDLKKLLATVNFCINCAYSAARLKCFLDSLAPSCFSFAAYPKSCFGHLFITILI